MRHRTFFISAAESEPAGIAAPVPAGSAPELSHKRTEPKRSCPACGTYPCGLHLPGPSVPSPVVLHPTALSSALTPPSCNIQLIPWLLRAKPDSQRISYVLLHWSQAEEVSMAVGRRGETWMGPETPAPPPFPCFLPPSPRRFLLRICNQLSAKSQKTPFKSFVCGILRNKPFVFNGPQSEIKD